MKKDVMIAITFAENGEFETARIFTPDIPKSKFWEYCHKIQKHFVAATFAESDMPEEARDILSSGKKNLTKEELLDILGINVNDLLYTGNK